MRDFKQGRRGTWESWWAKLKVGETGRSGTRKEGGGWGRGAETRKGRAAGEGREERHGLGLKLSCSRTNKD